MEQRRVEADLRLNYRGEGSYSAELVFNLGENRTRAASMLEFTYSGPVQSSDLERPVLNFFHPTNKAYTSIAPGKLLMAYDGFASAFKEVLGGNELPVRLRLQIAPEPLGLNKLAWETLVSPLDGQPLALMEDVFLSRFIPNSSTYPVQRVGPPWRVLAAALNPSGPVYLGTQQELNRIQVALEEDYVVEILPEEGRPVTLNLLSQHAASCDVLYLAGHAALVPEANQVVFYFENENGAPELVSAELLTTILVGTGHTPALVLLVTDAPTTGDTAPNWMAPFAETLVRGGIPAVITMQTGTERAFLRSFFKQLALSGMVDQAVSAGRRAVSGRQSWLEPVLYMSILDGRLWDIFATRVGESPAQVPPPTASKVPQPVSEQNPGSEVAAPPPPATKGKAPAAAQKRRTRTAKPKPESEPAVPLSTLDAYHFSDGGKWVVERARALATGTKRKKPVTSSMLLYAMLDYGQEHPEDEVVGRLYKMVADQPQADYQRLRDSYFKRIYAIGEEAGPSSGGKVPPDEMTPNVARIFETANGLSGHLFFGEMFVMHLLAVMIAPGMEQAGAASRLAELKVDLPALRNNLLNWLQPTGEGYDLEALKGLLNTGKIAPAQPSEEAARQGQAEEDLPYLTGFSTDDTTSRVDLIGIDRYVEAFAALIASRNVTPPLSIGLFGEWGSGKTFFMNKLKDEVQRLSLVSQRSGQMQRDLPFYKHIVQIEFNAWHYMEGNIWASLAEHILKKLAYQGEEEKPNEVMIELLQSNLELKEKARLLAEQDMAAARAKVQQAETALKDAQVQLERKSDQLAALLALDVVRKRFQGDLDGLAKELRLEPAIQAGRDTRDQLQEAGKVVQDANAFITPLVHARDRRRRIFFLLGVVALTALAAWLFWAIPQWVNLSSLAEALSPLGGALTFMASGAAWLNSQARWVARRTQEFKALKETYDTRLAQALEGNQAKIESLTQERDALQTLLASAAKTLDTATADEAAARKQVEQATPANLLAGWLRDRADSMDYRRHLGLLALIRKDFDTISSMMEEINWRMAPPAEGDAAVKRKFGKYQTPKEEEDDQARQVNRIVLYIDDLDRCPPDKVVDVLQAVHLLLGLPLFVVVVGVDARWIRQSLKARYRQMLHLEGQQDMEELGENIFGKATPDDYMEKIFQIPFWLKPMDKDASWRMIESLVKPAPVTPESQAETPEQKEAPAETPQPVPAAETPQAVAPSGDGKPAAEAPAGPGAQAEAAPSALEAPKPVPAGPWWQSLARTWQRAWRWLGGESIAMVPAAAAPAEAAPAVTAAVEEQPKAAEPAAAQPAGGSQAQAADAVQVRSEAVRAERVARSLDVLQPELDFMRQLSPLLGRSPRALKRFVNVYRLIKAGLPPEAQKVFAPPVDASGASPAASGGDGVAPAAGTLWPYQAVLLLLAVDTGLPDLARELFDALEDERFKALLNAKANLTDQLNWLSAELKLSEAGQEEGELADQRQKLRDWLEANDPDKPESVLRLVPDLKPLAAYKKLVERYSFQVYGLAEPGKQQPPADGTKKSD